MPDHSLIPMFHNSRNKSNHPTYADTVEQWDAITPPPRYIVDSVIRSPNAVVYEADGRAISAESENDLAYTNKNKGNDIHEIDEESEESGSLSTDPKCNEIIGVSEENTRNDEILSQKNMTKQNSSISYFPQTNSATTVAVEITIATIAINDTFKIPNKLDRRKMAPDLSIHIDLVEIFNILATFAALSLHSQVTSTTYDIQKCN